MIKVDTGHISEQAQQMTRIANQLRNIASSVSGANRALSWKNCVSYRVRAQLQSCNRAVSSLDDRTRELAQLLNEIAQQYDRMERDCLRYAGGQVSAGGNNQSTGLTNLQDYFQQMLEDVVVDRGYVLAQILALVCPMPITYLVRDVAGAWYGHEGDYLTVNHSGPGYEIADSGISAWGYRYSEERKDAGTTSTTNFHVGKVQVKREYDTGIMKYKMDEDGEESFSLGYLNAEVGVSGSILSLDYKDETGDGWLGLENELEGDLGTASGKGELDFSLGEDGVNAYAGGELIVAAAKGKAKSTINILGFEIGAEATGYLGGAGVEGEVGLKDGIFTIKGGAVPGVGGSVGISIGLNEEGKQVVDAIADGAVYVAEKTGEFVDGVKDGIAEAGRDFSNWVSDLF